MAKLREFNRVVDRFRSLADFTLVYVQEAHAADGDGALYNNYDIKLGLQLKDKTRQTELLTD